ncbi:MAG: hypothetical protein WA210_21960 [Burkholderiaceae bacterium]
MSDTLLLLRKQKVEVLLRIKFPMRVSSAPLPLGTDRSTREFHDRLRQQIDAERATLLAKPAAALDKMYAEAVQDQQARESAQAQFKERGYFFNHRDADADFDYWAKFDYWTFDEALALLYGKSPLVVTWEAVAPFVHISPFARKFAQTRTLAMRAERMGRGTGSVLPRIALEWAKRMDIVVPPALIAAVAATTSKSVTEKFPPSTPFPLPETLCTPTASGTGAQQGPKLLGNERDHAALPPSVSTSDIACAFGGVYWSIQGWKRNLDDYRAQWIVASDAKLAPGKRGNNPTQAVWHPVLLAHALLFECRRWKKGDFQTRLAAVDERFKLRDELAQWRTLWAKEKQDLSNRDS